MSSTIYLKFHKSTHYEENGPCQFYIITYHITGLIMTYVLQQHFKVVADSNYYLLCG